MRKRIICIMFSALLLLSGCNAKKSDVSTESHEYINNGFAQNDINSTEFTTVAENDTLILRLNKNTTDISVTVKATGYTWNTTGGIGNEGSGASVEFTYMDSAGAVTSMNSLTDSVKKGQYSIKNIENGIYITYSFGDIVNDLIYPTYISTERFEEFTGKMTSRNSSIVMSLYRHLAPDLYSDDMYESFLKDFPKAKDKDVYVLRNSDMLPKARKELAKAFEEAGYTIDDLTDDQESFGLSANVLKNLNAQFNIGVEYVLEKDDLVVRIPNESMYCSNGFSGIQTLSVMKYFGSPTPGDDGYFMLPDGCGSLMNFYNGRESAGQPMYTALYGNNYAITQNESIYDTNQAIMPVYGIKNANNAWFSVIEQGDAIAGINAVSGTETLSARVYPVFNILDTQAVYPKSLSDSGYYQKSAYTKEQSEPYGGDIKMRYHFLSNEKADYSGMAAYYRDYLFKDNALKANTLPLYLELVSAIDYEKTSAGFSNNVISTLTTFEQAGDIALKLKSLGIERQKLILSGWQKNGWRDSYVESSEISKAAGGKKGFLALSELLKQNNIEFFPETDVQFVYQSALSGGIKKNLVSRTLVQQLARKYTYNLSDYQKEAPVAYAMSPGYTADSIYSITETLSTFGIDSVSLRGVSKDIIPDYDDKNVSDRQESVDLVRSAVEKASGSNIKVLSRTGNAMFASSLSDIVELPLHSTGNNNCIYEIPFSAMVYSGNIEYSSKPMNLNGMEKKDILKLIESNSGVYFLLCAASDNNMKSSDFNNWFSICYDELEDRVANIYSTVNAATGDTYGLKIIRHDIMQDNVYKTTFENGKFVIVNYNEFNVEIDGKVIEASGYLKGMN